MFLILFLLFINILPFPRPLSPGTGPQPSLSPVPCPRGPQPSIPGTPTIPCPLGPATDDQPWSKIRPTHEQRNLMMMMIIFLINTLQLQGSVIHGPRPEATGHRSQRPKPEAKGQHRTPSQLTNHNIPVSSSWRSMSGVAFPATPPTSVHDTVLFQAGRHNAAIDCRRLDRI